ncbi:hypothetical protein Tcan_17163 [Toxocara canis]|uniref:Uncharacterized protein n=1 Tax=Toxocara canis TaxID=6265 RepID=A0A0B2VXN2_TOXCA|nr:hypothetical protein Tcan_17163 [Toxocara canis]
MTTKERTAHSRRNFLHKYYCGCSLLQQYARLMRLPSQAHFRYEKHSPWSFQPCPPVSVLGTSTVRYFQHEMLSQYATIKYMSTVLTPLADGGLHQASSTCLTIEVVYGLKAMENGTSNAVGSSKFKSAQKIQKRKLLTEQ